MMDKQVQSMRRIDYLRQTNEQILRKNSVRDRSRSPISLNRSLGNAYNPKTNDDIIKCLQNKENDLKKRGTEIKNLKDEITKLKEINNKKTQEITHLRKMVEKLQKCAECKDNFDVSEYLRCKNCVSKSLNRLVANTARYMKENGEKLFKWPDATLAQSINISIDGKENGN